MRIAGAPKVAVLPWNLIWQGLGGRPQSRLDCPKNALSSQTKNFTLGTTFSHSLGQKHYRKLKIENFCPFFKPAQAVQNFTT